MYLFGSLADEMDPLRAAGLISSDEEEDEDNKTGGLPSLANAEGITPQKRNHDDEDSDEEDSMDLKRTRQVISDSD